MNEEKSETERIIKLAERVEEKTRQKSPVKEFLALEQFAKEIIKAKINKGLKIRIRDIILEILTNENKNFDNNLRIRKIIILLKLNLYKIKIKF